MSTPDLQDLDSIDLADPTVWDDGPPYELFARMQREAPVHFSPQNNAPGEGGFWSITRFDDIRAISRDHKTFSSERRGVSTSTTWVSRWIFSGCS
jgi:cytochrome P450